AMGVSRWTEARPKDRAGLGDGLYWCGWTQRSAGSGFRRCLPRRMLAEHVAVEALARLPKAAHRQGVRMKGADRRADHGAGGSRRWHVEAQIGGVGHFMCPPPRVR